MPSRFAAVVAASFAVLGTVSNACGPGAPPEDVARRALSEAGLRDLKLTPAGDNVFDFEGRDGDQTCTGRITVDSGGLMTGHSWKQSCTSTSILPSTPPAPAACAPATPEACAQIGIDKMNAGDIDGAVAAWRVGCDGKSGAACNNIAVVTLQGKRGPVDAAATATAATLVDEGCAYGYGDACGVRAQLWLEATPPEPAKAFPLFERGCELSEKVCYTAAVKAYNGVGIAADKAKAAALAEKGCQGKAVASCGFFGLLLVTGEGGAKDAARGEKLLGEACDANDREACANLGVVLRDAMGVSPKDVAKAYTLFAKACALDYGTACLNVGFALDNGEGTTKDLAKALEAYRKACELDIGTGCLNAGIDYRDGLGTAADPKVAGDLFAKACKLGVERACPPK